MILPVDLSPGFVGAGIVLPSFNIVRAVDISEAPTQLRLIFTETSERP